MTRERILFVVACAAAAVAIGVISGRLWYGSRGDLSAPSGASIVSGAAAIGGAFELVDQTGETRTDADYRGRYMLVFFGYTHCPDFCPTALQAVADALDALEAAAGAAAAEQVVPIFVTVDPERDTPEALKDYASAFHPRLVALTGSAAQVAQAAKAYRVYYAKAGEGEDYLMDHSTFTYLMGPDGRYLAHFRHGTPPEEMAERIRSFM